ncbi:hypothetical protein [Streptomyces sp. NPDC088812]|uniref:hypothetical protein n=1 Tax=Streptomyces sp. NPDC088812 TaxID=3365905 RepID=UPI00382DF822
MNVRLATNADSFVGTRCHHGGTAMVRLQEEPDAITDRSLPRPFHHGRNTPAVRLPSGSLDITNVTFVRAVSDWAGDGQLFLQRERFVACHCPNPGRRYIVILLIVSESLMEE